LLGGTDENEEKTQERTRRFNLGTPEYVTAMFSRKL
jgi:hypothetical protein